MEELTLDHINGIKLRFDEKTVSNLQALHYLPIGILTLASTVRKEEINLVQEYNGNPPVLMALGFKNDGIIACCFNWFSVSLVNYLRLVSLVDLMNKNNWSSTDIGIKENHQEIKFYCREYVKEVVPEIYIWRNKIAAHFAITDPFHDDNQGTLEYSVMNPITYNKPYFKTGSLLWVANNEKAEIPEWSLTEVYEKLTPRLWPDSKLKEIPLTNRSS